MGNTNRKCGPDHPSRGEHRVLTMNKQQHEELPADVIIIQQPQQGIITQHQQQQHNLTKSIKHMTRALMSQQHSQPHQQQQQILANKSKSENTVYIPGCDQAAPNFPSTQNNLETAQQSMSPSMFKHYQTYMQDMSTMQQTFLQTFREEFTELITMATMIAKTATPPPDKGGTEPKGGTSTSTTTPPPDKGGTEPKRGTSTSTKGGGQQKRYLGKFPWCR